MYVLRNPDGHLLESTAATARPDTKTNALILLSHLLGDNTDTAIWREATLRGYRIVKARLVEES